MHCSSISGNNNIIFFHLSTKPKNFHQQNPKFVVKSSTKACTSTSAVDESFYQLLGITESGSLSEIKKAYKQLARKYHPDVSPADRAKEYTQRFILVKEAYETLADPQTRAVYDNHLSFPARTRLDYHQTTDERGEWKNKWMSQLSDLKHMRIKNNDTWGSRMRRQHTQ